MRRQRRAAAAAAAALGVLDIALAAAKRLPIRGPELMELPYNPVHGARYSLLLLGLGLLWAATSLPWGQRATWWLATVCAALSIPALGLERLDLLGLGAASAVTVLLVGTRRSFTAPPNPTLARRSLWLLALGEAVAFAYGTVGLYLLDSDFTSSTELTESALAAGRRMVLLPAEGLTPATRHGAWFLRSIPLLSLSAAAIAVGMLLRPLVAGPSRRRSDQQQVREILAQYGWTALAHFHLLPDKRYLFSPDRKAFIGYKVVGRVALALGEPVGPAHQRTRVAHDFVDMCERNGWLPGFHQLTAEGAAELAANVNLRYLKIGEEAIIDVNTFTLDDSRHKSVRSAVRRVERAGLRVVELPAPLKDSDIADLRSVSDAWMGQGDHRERTFTLGQFDPGQLGASVVLALRDETGTTAAFVSLVPSYQSNRGNFDLMRRRPDSPNGTMDVLFVKLIERFRSEGRTGMTLGLAPLSGISGDGPAERALKLLYERGGRAFNFAGVRSFKEKWHPRWEPRYLGYRREADLPRLAGAVVRAGELDDPGDLRGRVLSLARRLPGSVVLLSVIGVMMLATVGRPVFHAALLRALGLRYDNLLHGQLWRLLTAPLLQPRPGIIWSNVVILAVAVPAAELRLGWRRTLATCFLADTASTLLALAALRITSMTSPAAARALNAFDTGSSSLAWGAAAAFGASLPSRQLRRLSVAIFAVPLIGAVALHHSLDDVQHLVAAVIACCLTLAVPPNRTNRPAPTREQRVEPTCSDTERPQQPKVPAGQFHHDSQRMQDQRDHRPPTAGQSRASSPARSERGRARSR